MSAYTPLNRSPPEENYYKGKHYKMVINWKKRASDNVILSRVADLKMTYEQAKHCNYLTLHEYLIDHGCFKRVSINESIIDKLTNAPLVTLDTE